MAAAIWPATSKGASFPVSHMNCLIFEPDVTGHRLQHVRHLAEALLAIGCRVSIVLQSDALSHAEFKVHLAALAPQIELRPSLHAAKGNLLSVRRVQVRQFRETIALLRPDWAYLPHADGITQVASLECLLYGNGSFQRVPIEAQVMRGKYGYPMRSRIEALDSSANRWLTRRNPWRVTHVLDPFALRGLEPLPDFGAFRLIPEPVEPLAQLDRCEARQTLGIPTEGRYLSVVGGILPRKGIDLLLAAFAVAKLARDDRLLLVGKAGAEIRRLIDERYVELVRQGRIVAVDRYVTDCELHCGFLGADVVGVTHPRQIGSSGTLVRAAVARRPVLASNFGWVAWATDTFKLGATVNVSNVEFYAAAIEQVFRTSSQYSPNASAVQFGQYHTVANQKAHWLATIAAERGIAIDKVGARVEWHSVMAAVDPDKRILTG